MDNSESQQLLQTKLDSQVTKDTASMLSSRFEHLPLALVQAAAFIRENSRTPDKYIELLDRSDQDLIDLPSQPFETVGRDSDTRHPVAKTLMLSFDKIRVQSPLASDLPSFKCLLNRQGIPEGFVYDFYQCSKEKIRIREPRNNVGRKHAPKPSIGVDVKSVETNDSESEDFAVAAMTIIDVNSRTRVQDVDFVKSVGILKAFSFISEQEDGSLNMHRLVQLVTKRWLASQRSRNRFCIKK
ncbi:hypothetical protein B0J13DRAFT_530128 [Dactylonectria estremocensis]|uniref:Uncharacterized protein n=1 Tax=Dactylonectria estremocensis TaxID=1079267 RepID=A0A9P9E2C7_9HYPO|nr:hypothetical protein B0J13DRAFT_530128 [Dactylonectria estremocensis]